MIVSHWISGSIFLTMRNVWDKSCRENQNTHFVFSNFFFLRKLCHCAVYETMWENAVEPDRLQMTIWRMRIACWIPKATDTHSEYVIRTAFPLQQKLHECASMLRYTYIACLATSVFLLHVFLWILCQNLKHVQYKQCIANNKKTVAHRHVLHAALSRTESFHTQKKSLQCQQSNIKLPRLTVNEISCLLSE
jgi:hypothetical protein